MLKVAVKPAGRLSIPVKVTEVIGIPPALEGDDPDRFPVASELGEYAGSPGVYAEELGLYAGEVGE